MKQKKTVIQILIVLLSCPEAVCVIGMQKGGYVVPLSGIPAYEEPWLEI